MATQQHDTPGRMTIAEFQELPESDEFLYELDEGALVREPRPARAHGHAASLMTHHLVAYALEYGGAVTTETGYVLAEGPDTLRGPDVAWSRHTPALYGDGPDGFIRGAPDLAVEVLSPSDRWTAIRKKIEQYFAAGASLVWIVDPHSRSVTVHPSPDRSHTIAHDGVLAGDPILPGFRLPVADLFRWG